MLYHIFISSSFFSSFFYSNPNALPTRCPPHQKLSKNGECTKNCVSDAKSYQSNVIWFWILANLKITIHTQCIFWVLHLITHLHTNFYFNWRTEHFFKKCNCKVHYLPKKKKLEKRKQPKILSMHIKPCMLLSHF